MADAPPLVLPERVDRSEDLFVTAWLEANDLDGLEEVITLAMDARRPRLAARLVQALPEDVEVEPNGPLDKAQRAAKLLVLDSSNVELFNALDDAWRQTRRRRMKRISARQRLVGTNKQYTIPRVGRRPRKR
ncbi:MAG: hypothetical protein AB8H79_26660 [Myxococcota bacterium]